MSKGAIGGDEPTPIPSTLVIFIFYHIQNSLSYYIPKNTFQCQVH